MKKERSPLGRGLNALLPGEISGSGGGAVLNYFQCPVEHIVPNPSQPRKIMDDSALTELAASIGEKGVLLPLVVRHAGRDKYELIAGERRWRAAIIAQLPKVPVVVKDVSPLDSFEIALIENIQRQDLSPLEEADAYQRLITEFDLTQEEVARRVGKDRAPVANMLRILQLPEYAREDMVCGRLTAGHARALLSIGDNEEMMLQLRDMIVAQQLSVRQSEEEAKKIRETHGNAGKKTNGTKKKRNTLPDAYCRTVTQDLISHFGTKSRIIQNGSRGKIEIEYYSADDLERLVSLIIDKR
jgi:ParB family chromosome partitioning protein